MTTQDQKADFLQQCSDFASYFCMLNDKAVNLSVAWYLRAYQVGGAQEMTDADCAAIGCTAVQLQTAMNLMQALANLKSGAPVASSNQYDVFLQNARTLSFRPRP
jgi:hypothetical protein